MGTTRPPDEIIEIPEPEPVPDTIPETEPVRREEREPVPA